MHFLRYESRVHHINHLHSHFHHISHSLTITHYIHSLQLKSLILFLHTHFPMLHLHHTSLHSLNLPTSYININSLIQRHTFYTFTCFVRFYKSCNYRPMQLFIFTYT